ncbi:MAG: DUF2185 domain-containing protein [Janthinobacterium lividum]
MKNYKLKAEDFQQLVDYMGGCIATDRITVDGLPVHFMYRDEPSNEIDSGWQFFSGTETQEYIDDSSNSAIYNVNTIANYDPAIIPYLDYPIGTDLVRVEGTNKFVLRD